MNQKKLFHDDIYDAVRDAVQVLGGSKEVGYMLWPSKPITEAGQYLNRCLDSDRSEKLSLDELMMICKKSAEKGCHTIASYIGAEAGYKFIPVQPEDEKAELQKAFIQNIHTAEQIVKRLEVLTK